MNKIVVLTGSGISAESGLKTFRDSGGLWEGHDVMSVASPEGWQKDPKLVLEFYNERRRQCKEAKPNQAHTLLAELEKNFKVNIITQNVDDLHEKAGSSKVLHLHGELMKMRSEDYPNINYDCESDIKLGDLCGNGSQLRPAIVWFGEAVPAMEEAIPIVQQADILVIIGTSMVVYPAAGLINFIQDQIPVYLIDPKLPEVSSQFNATKIEMSATRGMQKLYSQLSAQ